MRDPLRFEFTSRGDPVAGRLWSAASTRALPLVLVAPALGASQRAPEIEALCAALARGGLAAATIDLPLQGERASRKLSARLLACATRPRDAADERLWEEFVRQAALDLASAADALASRGELAAARLGCVAFEPGAEAAARFAERDPRVLSFRRVEPGTPAAEIVRALQERLVGGTD